MKKLLLFFFLVNLLLSALRGQLVSVTGMSKPQSNGHFVEVQNGVGFVVFGGSVYCTAANKPQFRKYIIYKNTVSQDTVLKTCNWSGNYCAISDTVSLIADSLKVFKVKFMIGASTYIADSILVGVTFLSSGQSNNVASIAQTNGNLGTPKNCFIRGWGRQGIYAAVNPTYDRTCYIANPESYGLNGSVGYANFKLAQYIIDSLHLPVCIINGAVSGSTILMHQRNDGNVTDSTTLYGRMLRRYKGSKFKAPLFFVWHQGENDAMNNAAGIYESRFQELRDDWLQDYGQVPIMVIQIHDSPCGAPALSSFLLQDLQRHLGDNQVSICGIIPNAPTGNGHCHFQKEGYEEIAKRIFQSWAGVKFPKPVSTNERYGVVVLMSKPLKPSFVNKNHFRGSKLYSTGFFTPYSVFISGDTLKFNFSGNPVDTIFYAGFDWGTDTTGFLRDMDNHPAFAFLAPLRGTSYILNRVSKAFIIPNPAEDQISVVNCDSPSLYNSEGMLIGKYTYQKNIDISSLPQGVYLLKCEEETLRFIKK